LSVVALMFLLLPLLLLTTSPQKLVGLDLGLLGDAGALPPPPPGPVESLEVGVDGKTLSIRAGLRRTDVTSSMGDISLREDTLPPGGSASDALDLAGLQARLRELKARDPKRQRVTVSPGEGVPLRDVVLVMDAARADARGDLFPEVVLATEAAPTEATE